MAEPIDLETTHSDDKRSVQLTFSVGGKSVWNVAASTEDVDRLLSALDQSRRILEPIIPLDVVPAQRYNITAYDPRWQITPDDENRFAVLWIRHPGLGWQLFGFPRHEAGEISKWLRKIPRYATLEERTKAYPPEATFIRTESFVMSTHGLGFYYFGKDGAAIGHDPFDQVEYDSDRAAGIVAGAITERRLEEALKSIMRQDEQETMGNIKNFLFNPSSALGSFRSKIDLAFALNILSASAYKDLSNIKNIRNDFAHKLELDSFDTASISDRCKNFVLIDDHVGPVPDMPSSDEINNVASQANERPSPYLGFPDHKQRLANPRFRYVMSAQLIGHQLGLASNASSDRKFPIV